MPRKLTFLFAPIEAVGHFNACIGIGQQLLVRGHKVVFATPNSWKGKLEPLGFTEEYYQPDLDEDTSTEKWGEIIAAMAPALALPPLQKMEFLHFALIQEVINKIKDSDEKLGEIMEAVMPDLVLVDNVAQNPALTCRGVPWILSASISPLGVSSKNVPPALTGYSAIEGEKAVWKKYDEKCEEVFRPLFEDFKEWLMERGGPELKYNKLPFWWEYSPYANIYMYPEEIRYTSLRPDPPNWHAFDSFVRVEDTKFEIPKELDHLPGKLIYLSMGSIGCSELGLMRRLVSILQHSPHRFIVSKGPLGDQFTLGDNMWGATRVPQTNVLPLVDLVITHGGNNTVTESFYFGKRMIVLPLFADQLDNAQRVEETGHGIQFQPYHVTQEELLAGIEKLLGDELLERRMREISKRMQASNSQEKAAELVESVALSSSKKMDPSQSFQKRASLTIPKTLLSLPTEEPRRNSIVADDDDDETESSNLLFPPILSLLARRRSDA